MIIISLDGALGQMRHCNFGRGDDTVGNPHRACICVYIYIYVLYDISLRRKCWIIRLRAFGVVMYVILNNNASK